MRMVFGIPRRGVSDGCNGKENQDEGGAKGGRQQRTETEGRARSLSPEDCLGHGGVQEDFLT